jgi:hypothetical protein
MRVHRSIIFGLLIVSLFHQNLTASTEEDLKEITILMKKIEWEDDSVSYQSAIELGKFKRTAMPFLIEGLKSSNPKTRKWSARAITNIVGGYREDSGREDAASGGIPLLEALEKEDDKSTAWYIVQAIGSVRPDPKKALPVLIKTLKHKEISVRQESVEALSRYKEESADAKPVLLEAFLENEDDFLRSNIVETLDSIGLSESEVKFLSERKIKDHYLALNILSKLLKHPPLAIHFLQQHENILEHGDRYLSELMPIFESTSPKDKELRDYLLKREDLPSTLMVFLGSPHFLPIIESRMEKASSYGKIFLEACTRALGKSSIRIVKISETEQGDFKPTSAWPGSNEKRWAKGGGHGDGHTRVLITGKLITENKAPVINPKFFNTNDRMLLGQELKEPAPIKYDSKTGRFIFLTKVFAAYSMAKGQEEPGPYQTGSAKILIESDNTKSLSVTFYDEMPEVEIMLTPKVDHTR